MSKESIKPKEPLKIEYGFPGDQPKEVTNNYQWTCFADDYYREIKK